MLCSIARNVQAMASSTSAIAVLPPASNSQLFPIANPDKPQAACVILLDTSRSMRGAPIRALQRGLEAYRNYLANDPEAKLIVETAVITFSDEAKLIHPFSSVDSIPDIELAAGGWTSLGAAIDLGLQTIDERKAFYKEEGVDYYRPFLVLITDGSPTDLKGPRLQEMADKLQGAARDRKFIPLFFGTGNTDFAKLKQLVGNTGTVAGIDGARFEEFFRWLSKSVSGLKDSKPGEVIQFVNPTLPTAEISNPFAFEV